MNNSSEKQFNINDYNKPGYNMCLELDDEVEYLLEENAITSIKNNEPTVSLKRLVDGEMCTVAIQKIITALETDGPSDYLQI